MGDEPDAADPEQEEGADEEQEERALVKQFHFETVGVEGDDEDGKVAAGRAQAGHQGQVGGPISAAADFAAVLLPGGFEFDETLDEGEAEEDEHGEDEEPDGMGDAGGAVSGDEADGVEAGEEEDIDEDLLFEPPGVEGVDDDVGREGGTERPGEGKGEKGTEGRENGRDRQPGLEGQGAGGEGAKAFAGVMPVGIGIEDVIEDVAGRGAEAEGGEAEDDVAEVVPVGDLVRSDEGDEEDQVFEPLMGPNDAEPGLPHGLRGGEDVTNGGALPRPVNDGGAAIDGDGTARLFPDGEVDVAIAGVIKAARAEERDEMPGLISTAEVEVAVAAHDFVEEAGLLGELFRQVLVGGGYQDDPPARFDFCPQEVPKGFVDGEIRHLQVTARGQLGFEEGTPPQPPKENGEQVEGVSPHDLHHRLPQQVGLDGGAVKIDAEGD